MYVNAKTKQKLNDLQVDSTKSYKPHSNSLKGLKKSYLFQHKMFL